MDDKARCQSCGMPISAQSKNLGTEKDGSRSKEYCMFCYQKGKFTMPNLTMEGMIRRSVEFMSKEGSFTRDEAERISHEYIPNLKRWKK